LPEPFPAWLEADTAFFYLFFRIGTRVARYRLMNRLSVNTIQESVLAMPKTDQKSNMNWAILFLCWLVVTFSAMGSLFFSYIMEFAPCVLCWYQRIFLFPLVIVLAAGLFPLDSRVVRYALPLAIAGWLTAFYHNLLYAGIIPESIQPCSQGVSCTEKYIELFGFVSIPMLSLLSFSTVVVLLIIFKKRSSP